MFYLLAIIIFISLLIYLGIAFSLSNKPTHDRREENVELFKEEKKNLELSKNLSQESLNLLVNEREQILLQDVPEEKELVIVMQKEAYFRPLIFSTFTFLAICGIYFQPLSMGSLNNLQTHQSIYGFISADLEAKEKKRESVIQEINNFISRKETTASEIYFLSNNFRDINEFLISSILFKSLIERFPDEIPLSIFGEYAQILFFRDKQVFSQDVDIALKIALEKSSLDPIALTLKGIKHFNEGETNLALISWEKAKENTNDEEEKSTIQEAINTIKSMKNQ